MFVLAILPILVPLFAAFFGLGVAGTVFWFRRQADLARTQEMEKLAESLELSFSATDSFGLAKQLQEFNLFKRERSRWFRKGKVTNVMRGMAGDTEVYMFDYTYVVQAGNTPKRITQTVFFANDKSWFLPDFQLRPENWWLKLKSMLGMESDIKFEDNPEFSEKFWVKGELEKLVQQQFTPSLQGFLCEKPPAYLEGSNYYLIGYKPRKKLSADAARTFFQNCCEVVRLMQENRGLELLNLASLKNESLEQIALTEKLVKPS